MKYKYLLFLTVMLFLTLFYIWYEANRPRYVNWEQTYSPRDKIPYGTYIAWQSLGEIFPDAEYEQVQVSLYEHLDLSAPENGNVYMAIGRAFNPDEAAFSKVLRWVEKGNYLFVAATWISDTLLGFFSLETEMLWEKVPVYLNCADFPSKEYRFVEDYACYFRLREGFKGKTFGYCEETEKSNFVGIKYGKGELYFNLQPVAFTNYTVLDSLNGDYYYKAFSLLPPTVRSIAWDVHNFREKSSLGVILSYRELRLALYLLLGGMLLYVFFKVKREQRPVPVILPPQNRMLEFVSTISALYFKQKDHYAIALKEIGFFMEEVRFRYKLRTDQPDEAFVKLLSGRSGVSEEETAKLISLIREITEKKQVDETRLKALMKGIECFIK